MNNSLTSFRFFAFFVVFLFHNLVFPVGYLGVQAFFVLSGFLLTPILLSAKEQQSAGNYFLSFYGRRVLRIFPVYYFYLLALSALAALWFLPDMHSEHQAVNRFYKQMPWALTYTYNFYHASEAYRHTHLLSHFWSLAIEEQFYLIWPVAIFLIPGEKLKSFLWLVILAGPLLRWLTGELVASESIEWLGSNIGIIVYVSPLSHFDAFAIGGLIALYGSAISGKQVFWVLIGIVALGVATSACFESSTDWWGLGYSNFMEGSYKYVWGYTLFNWWFALCLVSLRDKNVQTGWLVSPWLVYLGAISYGLYIFHNAFIWLMANVFPEFSLLMQIVLAFICTVTVSAASYKFLEKPLLNMKDKWFPIR